MVDGAQGEEGRTLGAGGRYLIQGLLGEGGMASVHRAYDSVLDRNVAIKTMHSEFSREQSFRERFRREAQAVARLNHTNIVAVYDSGEEQAAEGSPVPFIVMEYVEGEPLRDALNTDIEQFGAMPTEKALNITADVLAALGASHEMGLVHRDIKPGNVMLTRRGVVKVMDFGIARAMQSGVTSMTQTGMVVGTPQYLSPEQALGRGVDARSDLYTTGVMLFELLTGQLPFDGDSPLSIAYHHVQTPPPVASSLNQAIPPAVDAFLARALAKDPAERFQDADAMRAEIARLNSPDTRGGNTPLVTGMAPGVGPAPSQQAMFPPLAGPGTQPQPQPQGGFGTPAPGAYGTPAPGYASPTPGGGYPAPAANPYQGGGPAAPASHGGGKSKGPMIAIAVVAVVVVSAVVGLMLSNADWNGDKPKPKAEKSHSAGKSGSSDTNPKGAQGGPLVPKGGYKDSDFTSCDNVFPDDQNNIDAPNFQYQPLQWAKECAARPAVGLKIKTVSSSNTAWRKGIVLSQNPAPGKTIKKGGTVHLTISTGR